MNRLISSNIVSLEKESWPGLADFKQVVKNHLRAGDGRKRGSPYRDIDHRTYEQKLRSLKTTQSRIQESLISPNANMLDMAYEQGLPFEMHETSMKLNESFWRLSWINTHISPLDIRCWYLRYERRQASGEPVPWLVGDCDVPYNSEIQVTGY
ncbi:hypothetical protein F4778DRAFT_503938 [Xylariomycetidae sp. FL2044]|nr:hypothetical protein F4778DRAFT_503938 [Xylariomycetidae sp. FL2044]